MLSRHRRLLCCLSLVPVGLIARTASIETRKSYIPFTDAQSILVALSEVLPEELKAKSPKSLATLWPDWTVRRDQEIRGRLARGDEDSIVNLLLFGTSFTRQPRLAREELKGTESRSSPERGNLSSMAGGKAGELIHARLEDLMRGLVSPGPNERLMFARRVMEQRGYEFASAGGRNQAKQFLAASVVRVLREQQSYVQALGAARKLQDPTEEFVERSKLYRERGLSLDTSLLPNFAIEESLKAMLARGLLAPKSIARVGIIGPGLDFTDKAAGYDFYPQQTLQPFALTDTLFRLGLASDTGVEVTTFDVSPRVNDHLVRARKRADQQAGYTLQLPRDTHRKWTDDALRYWERFGDQIGVPVKPVAVPAEAGGLKIRAVRVRPEVVRSVTPEDLNIVLERLDLAAGRRFDLMIATNVFVYYDEFEQSLAVRNVRSMLRPGGFLLSNNALLELPGSGIESLDYLTVIYSDRPDDGDHIVWYRRSQDESTRRR